jgi:hypothetical protein
VQLTLLKHFEFEASEYLSNEVPIILVLERWNICYSDAHRVAYLLDPRFTGIRMDKNQFLGF